MNDAPLVSINCVTYNHVNFIRDALAGFVMQQTTFPFEVLVHDDASTDGTAEIICEYERQYPHQVLPIYQQENQYSKRVPITASIQLPRARGKYIASCEGDDYWTDPYKLQKQVDFLEGHPECSMCFHNVEVQYQDRQSAPESFCSSDQKPISTLEDLLIMNFIPTASLMFRLEAFQGLPEWYFERPMDWPFFILIAQHGDIGYIDEVMAIYRMHAGGVWWWRDPLAKIKVTLPMYAHFYRHLGTAYADIIRTGASKAIAAGAAATYAAADTDGLASSLDFVQTTLDAATDAGYATPAFRRVTKAMSYEALGFVAYQKRNMRIARHCYTRALALDPTIARNKGVLSLWFEACFGEKASTIRRNLGARLRVYLRRGRSLG
jgi:glycosyltransferase involved in cell wall biosynthesis